MISANEPLPERMPPLDPAAMSAAQSKAAQELAAGPRGGVKGPFVPLLRSPDLMDRLQKVGEYLRFHSSLEARINELLMLVVARQWTQQFEWAVHVPLALKAGLAPQTVQGLAEGRRPAGMAKDEEIACDFCEELVRTRGVSDATYRLAVDRFGERGVIDMLGLIGYFTTVSMVMNVARTPPPKDASVSALRSFPF
jgi:4-carboxymuconolactone decarboxylase